MEMMGPINNPIADLAKLYETTERRMRWWAEKGQWKSMKEIAEDPEIKALVKPGTNQVRDVVRTFWRHTNVKTEGYGRAAKYIWDVTSPPFILGQTFKKQVAETPSEPVVFTPVRRGRPAGSVAREVSSVDNATSPDEMELVFKGIQVVVGKNPATGRLRVIIEG